MITPNDVKQRLMEALPRYTQEFGDNVSGSAVVASGVIKITSAGHGLATGAVIVGADVKIIVPVTGSSFDSGTGKVTLTTSFEHDRTSGLSNKGGYNKAVLQDFADSNYNGSDFTITSAERETITFDADADAVGALGNMIEPRSLLLGFLVVTKIDDNTFSVPLADTLIPEGVVFDTYDYSTAQRIFIAADATRAVTEYNKHRDPKPALFIVFGPEDASKDRNTVSDAVITATPQNPVKLTYLPQFTLMAMAVTKTEHLAATKQQQIYEEIRPALRKVMYAHTFESADTSMNFAAVEVSNQPNRWNTGYYVHNFLYSSPYAISFEQGDVVRHNVSFRDIVVNSTMFDNEGALVSLEAEPEI